MVANCQYYSMEQDVWQQTVDTTVLSKTYGSKLSILQDGTKRTEKIESIGTVNCYRDPPQYITLSLLIVESPHNISPCRHLLSRPPQYIALPLVLVKTPLQYIALPLVLVQTPQLNVSAQDMFDHLSDKLSYTVSKQYLSLIIIINLMPYFLCINRLVISF